MGKVVTLGEIMLRLSTPGNTRFVQSDSFDVVYGGGEANVAVSCANYGHEAYFVTKLPKHEIGQSAVNALRKYGVKTDFICRGGDRVGIYYLETGASMRPSKVIYDRAHSAIAEADPCDFDFDAIMEGADWFHWSGITPAISDKAAELTKLACEAAKRHGVTVSVDLNFRKTFPDALLSEGDALPLFCDELHTVVTDEEKAGRVWRGLQKKVSSSALGCLTQSWLSELPEIGILIFRYIRKAIDAPRSIETNFGDPDVLQLAQIWKKVDGERVHLMQFVRFQKAADGTFFAAFEPQYNALPLTVHHFKDRFADQKWIIYDMKRRYGFYYDLQKVTTISFDDDSRESHLITGMLDESLMDKDEKLFQQLWKTYFKAICIKERMNPRKHRQDMPVRYWKYLTEKQK